MFEIGSSVVCQKDKTVTGKVKNIHFDRAMWRIICVELDSGPVTWFTPAELVTPSDVEEYMDWLESGVHIPYAHEVVYDTLTSDGLRDEIYRDSINYGLKLYLNVTKKEAKANG